MAQWVKHLSYNHENHNSDFQNPSKARAVIHVTHIKHRTVILRSGEKAGRHKRIPESLWAG